MFLQHDARTNRKNRTARRRWSTLILSVAAASAVSMTLINLPTIHAQNAQPVPIFAADQQPMSNGDRLAKGVQEYNNKQYEESLADLQQVNGDQLGMQEQKDLADTLIKAQAAATQRKAARAEFEQGEESLAANKPADAAGHYKAALNNKFVDDGTAAKSKEQLAVAEAGMKQAGQSLKDLYNSAVADYKGGNLNDAKGKFEQLQANGYKAGLFQKSPNDYLKDINNKLASAPPPPTPAPVVDQTQTQTPPVTPATQPAPAPAVAENPTPQTPQAPTTPPVVAENPTPTPPPATAPDMTAMTPTTTPAVADQTTTTEIPQAAPVDAKAAYKTARQQYRSGDWIAARKNFELARDNGYKPGLFEDSPQKYLDRMTAKEQHDAQMAAQQQGTSGGAVANADQDANKAEAQKLVEQAEAARAAGRMDEALTLYAKASDLDPSNTAAAAGKNDLTQTLGRTTGQTDILAQQATRNQQQRDYISYSFHTAIDDANSDVQKNDFKDAQDAIERARVARNINPGVFRDDELKQFDATIADTQLAKDKAQQDYNQAQANASRLNTAKTLEQTNAQAEAEKRRTVTDLTHQARQLTVEGHYVEAEGVLDQILKLDPNNDFAVMARPLVEDRALVQEQKRYRDSFDRNMTQQLNAAEEEKIPYNEILQFPQNWPDLSARRDKTVSQERGERPEDIAVQAQLDRKLPEVKLDGVGFADVIEFLRDVSSANIFVNWRAIEAAGINRDAPVTARLRDVKFSKALDTILKDVGGTVKLSYTIDEGVITISTEEDLATNVVTRVYDIRDLIINVPDFNQAPAFQLQQQQATRGGGGGQNLFGGGDNQQNNAAGQTRQELVDSITKLIEDTVNSDSWKDNGGTVGSIRELGGQLIVTQSPENQRQLTHLLEQLRETRAIQITVETRFLTVQRNFLDEIGVDFDVLLNPNGQISNKLSPIALNNNSAQYTQISSLLTAVPGNIATELTANSTGGGSGSATAVNSVTPNFSVTDPATGGGVTFLDDFQVSLLLRATQISQNTTSLTAPRLTLFNGQRAFVVVATQTAYVSDVEPIVGTNAVAFNPDVATVNSGVELTVQATVSADRKYVTLTLVPTLSRLRALVNFPVSAINNVTTTDVNGNQTTSAVTTAFIQEPVTDVATLGTTVSVPDGGTLLLGGQTLAGEIERDSGVPVLSKIPFLKRLFTNTSMAKDEQILLILVKPTIIIQREKEEDQFPL